MEYELKQALQAKADLLIEVETLKNQIKQTSSEYERKLNQIGDDLKRF